jgi:hypothetical protein
MPVTPHSRRVTSWALLSTWDCRTRPVAGWVVKYGVMFYAVGQTVEVCLDLNLPLSRGIRRVVGVFENEEGQFVELSDVPARMSDCVVQEPTQIALQGRAAHPGVYGLRRLEVEHLLGVTHVSPPEVSFEVRGTPEVVGWRMA